MHTSFASIRTQKINHPIFARLIGVLDFNQTALEVPLRETQHKCSGSHTVPPMDKTIQTLHSLLAHQYHRNDVGLGHSA